MDTQPDKFRGCMPLRDEIIKRCRKRGTIRFSRKEGVYRFRLISAYEARDRDGSGYGGWPKSDRRVALEEFQSLYEGTKRWVSTPG